MSDTDLSQGEGDVESHTSVKVHAPQSPSSSSDLRDQLRDLVDKAYIQDAIHLIDGRNSWKRVGDSCEAAAKLLSGAATVLSFAASSTNHVWLSFAAGCIGTTSLVVLLFSSYSLKESRERTHQLNAVLGSVGIAPLPTIVSTHTNPAGHQSLTSSMKLPTR